MDELGRLDADRPSAARLYDYLLGGAHNFAVDRDLGDAATRAFDAVPAMARANRSFLRRSVSYLVERGVDQFLDLGSGIPSVGNVHEIAQAANPAARVVYVDIEPVAIAHGDTLLVDNPGAAMMRADVRDPESVLTCPRLRDVLDLSRPVAVLLVSVLHWFAEPDVPDRIVATYRSVMAPGSHLVVSHVSSDDVPEEARADIAGALSLMEGSQTPVVLRSRDWIVGLFDGMDVVEPGVTQLSAWRPDSEPDPDDDRYSFFAGVGRVD